MADIVQIIIQIQKKQPEIKNLKGLTKLVYDNLNPRKISSVDYCVTGGEIVDFLMMYGLERETSNKLLEHMCAQAFLNRINRPHMMGVILYNDLYTLNFKD